MQVILFRAMVWRGRYDFLGELVLRMSHFLSLLTHLLPI